MDSVQGRAPRLEGLGFRVSTLKGPVLVPRRTHAKAGKRIGSLCAIEVKGLKRRSPTEVGGLTKP